MLVDILGGIFSFLSLFFRKDLDIAAFVSYSSAFSSFILPIHPLICRIGVLRSCRRTR